jgi:hypothetical protein
MTGQYGTSGPLTSPKASPIETVASDVQVRVFGKVVEEGSKAVGWDPKIREEKEKSLRILVWVLVEIGQA